MHNRDSILIWESYNNSKRDFILEAFDTLGARVEDLTPEQLTDYIIRVINRSESPVKKVGKDKDYFKMPHIHPSVAKRVMIQTTEEDGSKMQIDLDEFAKIISQRPTGLLRQNDKMKKSATVDTVFYNTTLPALRGLIIDEETGKFKIINTCPSAGSCQLVCYAKHGSYTMYPDTSLFQHKTLNYLFNDHEGYRDQIIAEINLAIVKNKKKKVQIRWNDSGDLLSPKFFDIVMFVVNSTPNADHYIYTKEVAMVKNYPNPPQNVIFNFSYGGRKEQEQLIDPVKDKVSYIVDIKDSEKEPVLNQIKQYIELKNKQWIYKDSDSVKKLIAERYKIDVNKILTIDELAAKPQGSAGEYNVIVLPGESDLSASRRDVRGTYLIIH